LGSAVLADAVSGLLESYGYECYTKEPLPCEPDVIIIDSSTIDRKGVDSYPKSRVLLLETDARTKSTARAILFQKVHGIISHTADSAELKKALEVIIDGHAWIDSIVMKNFLLDAGRLSNKGQILSLTPQEKVIVESICRGDTNKEIAQKLHISSHTVKKHLRNIMTKTGAVNRTNLASMLSRASGDEDEDGE